MKKHLILCGISLLTVMGVTACGKQDPAVFNSYGVDKGAGSVGVHTVLAGDTVYTISKNYQLPMREIITLNNMQAPYVLNTGYRMKLPPPNEYKARAGDTVTSIARLYEVSPNRLASLNNLSAPYNLEVGQVVRLPSLTSQNSTTNVQRATVQPSVITNGTTGSARVESVESQTLDDRSGAVATGQANSQGEVQTASIDGLPPQPKPQSQATKQSEPVVTEVAVTRAKLPKVTPKMSGNGKFMRPVDGKIISSYGAKADGLHNDGINIKAVRGTPVRAAENGVVVYNGDDLAGYGNLVLIRHENKMMSAYAHLDKTLVKRGAKVVRGQSIGTVGSSGQVDSPQLHFEIRKGSTPLNPAKYL